MASTMERPVVPGHFMLPLPTNKIININREVVTTKLRELEYDLTVRIGGPEELAIRNLQGLLSLRLCNYEAALGHFHTVLAIDSENLNALANLQYVTEKLFWMTDAQVYKSKLNGLMNEIKNGGPPIDKDKLLLRKARCLAEQAYAYACDIHIDRAGESRYIEANDIYTDAFKLAHNLDPRERDCWNFCMAKNAHKIFDFLSYKEEYADALKYLKTAENLFYEVTKSGDCEYQWESWRHLADIFRGLSKRWQFKRYVVHQDLLDFKIYPRKCMEKALEIAPENAKLWARYANFEYSVNNKNTNKAMWMLQKSIVLDGSKNNFYAHATKARINLTNYKHQSRDTQPDLRLLEDAKSDLEKSISMSVTPWDLSYLGEVYHLLAKSSKCKSQKVRKHLENALLYFTRASECEDGKSRSDIHLKRGQCLFDMGEYDAAIGCFKQAIACEPKTSKFTSNFNELFQVYLCVLQQEMKKGRKKLILPELVYNLKVAQFKYGNSSLTTHCISKMKRTYEAEVQVVIEYCQRFSEHKELVPLLKSTKEPPLYSPCLPLGGSLAHLWKASLQPHQDQGSSGSQGNLCELSRQTTHNPHALKLDREDEIGLTEAAGDTERQPDNRESVTSTQVKDAATLAASMQGLYIEDSTDMEQVRGAPDKARVSGFQYDFYVVYPDSIKDWVLHTLLHELERMWKLKGCTRHTQATPGALKMHEELEQMKESASILLVICSDFLLTCEYMMHQALKLRKEPRQDPGQGPKYERVIIPVLVNGEEQVPELLDRFNPFDASRDEWKTLATCIEQQIKPVCF